MPDEISNDLPPILIPDHELIKVIGRGSYGEVWLGRNAKLGVYRAIKIVFRSDFQERLPFEREFNGIKNCEPISRAHQGIVDILGVGGTEDFFYYVMELADPAKLECRPNATSHSEGDEPIDVENYTPNTLKTELKSQGRIPIPRCIEIAMSLSSALVHLHGNNLVHRDIKPSNIIFVRGTPKLADVGLVSQIDEAKSLVGTAGFVPPEGPGTPQGDLFSLSRVLYEISAGKNHIQFPEAPTDLLQLPDRKLRQEYDAIVLKAGQNNVKDRYQSAAKMHQDLRRLASGNSLTRDRIVRRIRRPKAIGISVVAIMLLILGVVGTNKSNAPGPEAKEIANLQGRWMIAECQFSGQPVTNQVGSIHLIKSNEIFRPNLRTGVYRFELDPATEPKQINLSAPRLGDQILKGVYQLTENTFTICYAYDPALPRPVWFDTLGPGSFYLYSYRRVQAGP